ncbi:hypothetical protein Acr_25g0000150 [Actinidia rufa]|uniref:Uncharacterized protein n=1 Tax=Actinidia rufa TaxID=165716 RepID=A0A7J0GXT6_9ERIC|nr:hypothetical protein Acr_25g0000150 [Actinidia rufa]
MVPEHLDPNPNPRRPFSIVSDLRSNISPTSLVIALLVSTSLVVARLTQVRFSPIKSDGISLRCPLSYTIEDLFALVSSVGGSRSSSRGSSRPNHFTGSSSFDHGKGSSSHAPVLVVEGDGRAFGYSISGYNGGGGHGHGRGRGRGPRKCAYCHQENHNVDLHGRPTAHQVTVSVEETLSSDHAPRVVSISEKEYHRFLATQSSTTVTLAQTKIVASVACVASSSPWVIDFDFQTRKKIGGGSKRNGLYYFDTDLSSNVALQSSTSAFQDHCHLGHSSLYSLKKMVSSSQFVHISLWSL